jgi:hypothetical protein
VALGVAAEPLCWQPPDGGSWEVASIKLLAGKAFCKFAINLVVQGIGSGRSFERPETAA